MEILSSAIALWVLWGLAGIFGGLVILRLLEVGLQAIEDGPGRDPRRLRGQGTAARERHGDGRA